MFIYVSTFPCDYWEPTLICWVQTSNVGRGAGTLTAVLQTNQVFTFLKLPSPVPLLQGWGAQVPFTNHAKVAFDNLEEHNPNAYHLVWSPAWRIAYLVPDNGPLTCALQPTPQAACALPSTMRTFLSGPSSFLPPCKAPSPCHVLLSALLLAPSNFLGLGYKKHLPKWACSVHLSIFTMFSCIIISLTMLLCVPFHYCYLSVSV